MECAKQAYWKKVRKQPEGHNKPTHDDMIAYADNSLAKKMFHKIRRQYDKQLINLRLKEWDMRYNDWLPEEVYEKGYYKGYQEYKPHLYADYIHIEHNHKQKLKEVA